MGQRGAGKGGGVGANYLSTDSLNLYNFTNSSTNAIKHRDFFRV